MHHIVNLVSSSVDLILKDLLPPSFHNPALHLEFDILRYEGPLLLTVLGNQLYLASSTCSFFAFT